MRKGDFQKLFISIVLVLNFSPVFAAMEGAEKTERFTTPAGSLTDNGRPHSMGLVSVNGSAQPELQVKAHSSGWVLGNGRSGAASKFGDTIDGAVEGKQKKRYERIFTPVKEQDIPEGAIVTTLKVQPSGDPEFIQGAFKAAPKIGVRPLVEHMKEEARDRVCSMNSLDGCTGKTLSPFSRDSYWYFFNYLKDTLWVWDPDISAALMKDHFGRELHKEYIFYALKNILGPLSLFGSDASETHKEKRAEFKSGLGSEALGKLMAMVDGYAKNAVISLLNKRDIREMREEGGSYLMATIISIVFGFDIREYPEKYEEIRGHFRGIVEPSLSIPLDDTFQMMPWFLKYSYVRMFYPSLFAKSTEMRKDVDWLVEKAKEKGVLDIDDSNPEAPYEGKYLRSIYKRRGGVLTDEDRSDLLNPTIAGSDTGSIFIHATFAELARNEVLQQELREEVFGLLEEDGVSPEDYGEHVWTPAQLNKKRLPKFFLFVEEVLMKFPPVPFDSRKVKENFSLYMKDNRADGEFYIRLDLKAGETIIFPIYYLNPHLQNDNKYFPEEMLKLDLEERVKHVQTFANPSMHHQCPGQHFARLSVSELLINMLTSGHTLSLSPALEKFNLSFVGTTAIDNDVTIVVGDRVEEMAQKIADLRLEVIPPAASAHGGGTEIHTHEL
ncbi:cytochrome P450 [Sansalvadorimonas verongulae]|uniref:cytochrome P450 n=1 Tax=Sansalvadorimonas verongulae TaxID=2172824 RepID=UPI0012BC2AE4|nr:cytochrome P450 [Sansalvadorimonas verongulae]MTI13996.1 cytochrome P450 [Sansalvadorimonas verongulae]